MSIPAFLNSSDTVLVIIDIQDKLAAVMHQKERLVANVIRLIRGITALEIPVLLTEQYPAGLGKTLSEIFALIPDISPMEKVAFRACDEDAFRHRLEETERKQVLIAGIETHICVYQTALDLHQKGYQVHVVADCVSSRNICDIETSLSQMGNTGINLTTTEMALFELLRVASGDKFKQISRIIK